MKQQLTENAQHVQQQIADAAAGVSVASFLGITLAEWETVVNIGVGMVGMIAGIAAAWWHIDRILEARRERRRKLAERVQENAQSDGATTGDAG